MTAELSQQLAAEELTGVQKSAEGWRTALGGIIGLIGTLAVVKGQDSIATLPTSLEWTAAILVFAAIASAAVGAYKATKAAYGIPKLVSATDLIQWKPKRAAQSAEDLRWAIRLSFITLGLAMAAVGVTWLGGKTGDPSLLIETTWVERCGQLALSTDGQVTLKKGTNEYSVWFVSVQTLQLVDECPK